MGSHSKSRPDTPADARRENGALLPDGDGGRTNDSGTPSPAGIERIPMEEMARDASTGSGSADRKTQRVRPPVRQTVNLRPRDHGPADDYLRAWCPNLAAYIYDGTWDGIQPREGATLTIRAKGGLVMVSLKCPTEGNESPTIVGDFSAAIEALERFCASSESQWIEMRYGTGKQKRADARKKELDKLRTVDEHIA